MANEVKDITNNEELQLKIRELKKEVARLHSQIKAQKYGLTWLDVPEAFDRDSEDKIPILEEVKDKAISSPSPLGRAGEGLPHILIEGDNYHALTCLNYTHKGKIDVIYIDPPYNTGNDGFTYKDKRFLTEFPDGTIVPKEHPLRHSYWLSFMSKRLELAKNLLSDKGVIFISIDDNEQANLKLLCDKVFGITNFITNLIWKSKSGGANDARFIAVDSEYVLMYAKNIDKFSCAFDSEATVTTSYNREDENGKYALDRLDKQSLGYMESLDFPITAPDGTIYRVEHRDPNHKVARWRWGKDTVKERYDELVFENGCVYTKNYEKESSIPRNLLIEERFGRTRSGKTELFSIIGANDFPNPKPSRLISWLIKLFPDKNCKVIDFFAGSGTTMNAVLSLNKIDGGNRQCVLCTNNENSICSNITYPRLSNIIQGYKSQGNCTEELLNETLNLTKLKKANKLIEKANQIKEANRSLYNKIKTEVKDGALVVSGELSKDEQIAGLGGSLKYYKTDFVGKHQPREANDDDKVALAQKAGCLLALGENTLEEVETTAFYQIFSNCCKGEKHFAPTYTGVYFSGDAEMMGTFTQKLETLRNQSRKTEISAYFFCWDDGEQFENEFVSTRQIKIKTIPQPILEIYKSLNA